MLRWTGCLPASASPWWAESACLPTAGQLLLLSCCPGSSARARSSGISLPTCSGSTASWDNLMRITIQLEQAKVSRNHAQRMGSQWLEVGLRLLWKLGATSLSLEKRSDSSHKSAWPKGICSRGLSNTRLAHACVLQSCITHCPLITTECL